MLDDLVLLHCPSPARSVLPQGEWFYWQTCMRQIALGLDDGFMLAMPCLDTEVQFYRGAEAYRFLLQVVCGLHSPLLAETEVYGQFRKAVAIYQASIAHRRTPLTRIFPELCKDAKAVREAHLSGLGSQSYGSLVRRELKGLERVHIFGSGHLVKEILPWLSKDRSEVHVHCRDMEKARRDLGSFSSVRLNSLHRCESLNDCEGLVVAAPMSTGEIEKRLTSSMSLRVLIDLRGEAKRDPVQVFARVVDLASLLGHLSLNRALILARKAAAMSQIDAIVQLRACHVDCRPFGWEDLSAPYPL